MKLFYNCFLFLICYISSKSQVVNVSGQCIAAPITLTQITPVNGKTAYQNTGTVSATNGVTVSVYWLATTDNVWVLDFDGQPYYQNPCNTTLPSATGNNACPWSVVPGQICTGVDPLVINGSGALPIKLISFTGLKENKSIVLTWKTASETNNKGFEIQRSTNGLVWNAIGFVPGSINSSLEKTYQFTDATPASGKNFYRLAQIDLDDKVNYSANVAIDFFKAGFYTLTSNPGNGLYKLTLEATNQKTDILIVDVTGRKILDQQHFSGGAYTLDISKQPRGTYFLLLRKEGNMLITEKLIKQ